MAHNIAKKFMSDGSMTVQAHTVFLLDYIGGFVPCLPVLQMRVITSVILVPAAAQNILQLYYTFKNTSVSPI